MVKSTLFTRSPKFKIFYSLFFAVIIYFVFAFGYPTEEKKSELDGLKVPEGFSIENAVPPGMLTYPMFASFDGKGRLFVFESDGSSPNTAEMTAKPPYHIKLLEDTNEDGIFDKSSMFADSLTYPKGGVYYNGSLYVTSAPNLLRLTDTNADGVADKREVILSGWVLNHNGALLGGPFFGPDGWMYLTDARRGFDIVTKEGEQIKGKSARIWRCRPDGTGLEYIAGGGYDNAIELAFMPSGETVGTMTYFIEPQGGMRDAIMHWVEGGVYPKPNPVINQDNYKLTGDLMPVMTKMARVAPSGLTRYRGTAFGKEYDGNLFSAEFNTGRIMRHQILPDGATYRTVDEPFITSTTTDIHLTDVLQDADGSMLVVNTGGWFISGCPLSRVAKLDIQGGIYRIKKNTNKRLQDPWGAKLSLQTLSLSQLTPLLIDQRPVVRDNVIERLVEIGEPAVGTITKLLLGSVNKELRAAGIFALSRINSAAASKEVLRGLYDKDALVRTASARVLGLAKNKEAVGKLMEMVQRDEPAVRRQAATALGQIGNKTVAIALLNAAGSTNDRVVEHAVIYSLISLENPSPLIAALTNSSAKVKRAAIIALDQMDGERLRKENLAQFLMSNDKSLKNTGIWVASHHPEWADLVIRFLQKELKTANLSGPDASALRNLMITFSKEGELQNFLANRLASKTVSVSEKVFLLDVITNSSVKDIPNVWVQQLGQLVQSGNVELLPRILTLIKNRNIKELNPQLNGIFQNSNSPASFRLNALSSRLNSEPQLTQKEFGMVLSYLNSNNDPTIRQTAANVLAGAKLTDEQLVTLARDYVAKTEVFLMPNLVNAFERNNKAVVGDAFISALQSSDDRLDNLSEQDLNRLFQNYSGPIRTKAEPLMSTLRNRNAGRLNQLQTIETQLTRGDVSQGRKLFYGKAICSSCHAVNGEGSDFAPDLTNIGQIRSRHDILEAILFPSASFAREHETSRVSTKTSSYNGIVKQQLPEALILSVAPGQNIRVQRKDITSIETQNISLMPPGLDKQLSRQELSDLMEYLTSLPDGMGGRVYKH